MDWLFTETRWPNGRGRRLAIGRIVLVNFTDSSDIEAVKKYASQTADEILNLDANETRMLKLVVGYPESVGATDTLFIPVAQAQAELRALRLPTV